MKTVAEIRSIIESSKPRSAWEKGVHEYAKELLGNFESEAATIDAGTKEARQAATATMRNGAYSWSQYSYGGCSHIYDSDIAEAVCTPSELKRSKGGELQPNSRETWLDVQARALTQAANLILSAAKERPHRFGDRTPPDEA